MGYRLPVSSSRGLNSGLLINIRILDISAGALKLETGNWQQPSKEQECQSALAHSVCHLVAAVLAPFRGWGTKNPASAT
jgi:hypothetical protein